MQRLEVSGAVRPIYGSLGVKRLTAILYRLAVNFTQNIPHLLQFLTFLFRAQKIPQTKYSNKHLCHMSRETCVIRGLEVTMETHCRNSLIFVVIFVTIQSKSSIVTPNSQSCFQHNHPERIHNLIDHQFFHLSAELYDVTSEKTTLCTATATIT